MFRPTHPLPPRPPRRSVALLLLLAASCLLSGCMRGQRLITVQIQQDGKPVLECMYGLPDNWKIDRIWSQVAQENFHPVDVWVEATSTTDGVILKGPLKIMVLHGTSTLATSELSELRLVEMSKQPPEWRLGPGEMERAAAQLK